MSSCVRSRIVFGSPGRLGAVLGLAGWLVATTACTKAPGAVQTSPTPPAVSAQPAPVPASPAPPAPVAAPAPPAAPAAAAAPARPPAPPPLLGLVVRQNLKEYEAWKSLFVQPYVPDAGVVETIKAKAADVTVLLIMATWCPDSKRELPRFFAIMDAANLRDTVLTMIAVDRTKKDPGGLTEKWGITRVPTFVFLRNGQEVGRVVEKTPAGSTLEAEIAKALGG
jgi:thiol-disulfide isomerase/thioredoxin